MAFFFSFLSWIRPWWKTAKTDYETVLKRLTKDINDVQARLIRVQPVVGYAAAFALQDFGGQCSRIVRYDEGIMEVG